MEQPYRLDTILKFNASADSNPFATAAQLISKRQNLVQQPYVGPALVAAGVVYLVICSCCIAIVLLPFWRGPESYARHNWFVKRHYSEHYQTPYLILNTLVIAVNHLISSVLFIIFIFFQYRTLDHHTSMELYGYTWMELRWLNAHVAFFTQGLTTWYNRGTVLSSNRKSERRGISPLFFNILLIGFPIVVGPMALLLTLYETNAFEKQLDTFDLLSGKLTKAGFMWERGRNLTAVQLEFLAADFTRYMSRSVDKVTRIQVMNLFWTGVGIPTIALYVFGALSMLQTIRAHINDVKLDSAHGSFDKKLFEQIDVRGSPSSPIMLEERTISTLGRSFKYLCGHYFVMSLVIVFDVGVGVAYYFQSDQTLVDSGQMSMFLVMGLSGSLLLLLALLIILVRMIVEDNEGPSCD